MWATPWDRPGWGGSGATRAVRRRANIARTLVHDPDVLILDEATASLDIISSQFIMQSLKQIRDNGKAILFSTHIMSEAERLCDRVAIVHKGRLHAQGTVDELREQTGQPNLEEAFFALIQEDAGAAS